MAASKAKQALTSERRTELFRLRLQGVKYDDPRILALGYATPGAASKDVIRGLKSRRDEEAAEVSIYRQQENERLDSLLEAVWDKATTPSPILDRDGIEVAREIDLKAVDTVLKLMDRRAKLNGLDSPVRNEITGAGGGPLQMGSATSAELEALIGLGQSAATADPIESSEDAEDGSGDG